MSKKRRPRQPRVCEQCAEFIPIGEGDHICTKDDIPRLVVEGYIPTDEYGWCNRRQKAEGAE